MSCDRSSTRSIHCATRLSPFSGPSCELLCGFSRLFFACDLVEAERSDMLCRPDDDVAQQDVAGGCKADRPDPPFNITRVCGKISRELKFKFELHVRLCVPYSSQRWPDMVVLTLKESVSMVESLRPPEHK